MSILKNIFTLKFEALFVTHGIVHDCKFKKWPEGNSPEEIGNRVQNKFLATSHVMWGNPNSKYDKNHYLNRPRAAGEHHGQAPLLWCAMALMRK